MGDASFTVSLIIQRCLTQSGMGLSMTLESYEVHDKLLITIQSLYELMMAAVWVSEKLDIDLG